MVCLLTKNTMSNDSGPAEGMQPHWRHCHAAALEASAGCSEKSGRGSLHLNPADDVQASNARSSSSADNVSCAHASNAFVGTQRCNNTLIDNLHTSCRLRPPYNMHRSACNNTDDESSNVSFDVFWNSNVRLYNGRSTGSFPFAHTMHMLQ